MGVVISIRGSIKAILAAENRLPFVFCEAGIVPLIFKEYHSTGVLCVSLIDLTTVKIDISISGTLVYI